MTFLIWTIASVTFLALDFALGVKVGRLLKQDEPEDPDDNLPLPTSQLKPGYVPAQWQFSEDSLQDPAPYNPAP